MRAVSPEHLRSIKTLPALLAYLRDELDWPIEAGELDELTFEWGADQLRVSDSQVRRLTDGVVRQLRPLAASQPWGIFVVEFADDTFRRGALREILRGLVANRRRDPSLPAWQHDNLLFICATRDYDQITFAHYRGEKTQKARLALFGWQCGSSYLRTLCEFNLPALRWPEDAADTSAWLKQWASAFDKEPLTKEFFKEIANWYFWTLKNCRFPKDAPKEADGYDHISVIRLITRLIFCWFIREKGLIPDALFDEHKLAEALLGFDPGKAKNKDSVFYCAILQNLFFATLNTEMDKRGWAKEDQNFMAHNLYRHKEYFRKPGEALALFKNIPFLNGGLFECLDKDFGENAKPRYLRIDGFSRRPDSQPVVPDFLFFGPEQEEDLSKDYGDKKFRKVRVQGLIDTLKRYHFTIEENTPFDQEVALDPELCGKVFENLLAAYNPETGTTARKATGSFYTPREIVDYMVDESLVAFLNGTLAANDKDGIEKKIRQLLAYTDEPHGFNEAETEKLIDTIDHLKALDPAVGSGAFPMGILHKLVHVLKKLDPDNERWKAKQIAKLDDVVMREEAERVFRDNYDDYGRKLYLIENCIYGVDIQPIAVQIAKMRFFISLIVDQKVDLAKPNLGVRALPNLETKFVTANSLIALDHPGFLPNQEVERLRKQLAQVRHDHFNAKTPRTKDACRNRDQTLRRQIADVLENNGFPSEVGEKLAAWDPYDQNASAGFFDPEWMFGVKDGFDVVIGNPPYGADIPDDQLEILKAQLKDTNNSNSAALFIDYAKNKIIKSAGVVAFIVPKSLLFSEKWFSLAQALAPRTVALVDVEQAFENVLLEQVVFVYDGARTHNTYTAQKFIGVQFSRKICLPLALLQRFKTWLCDVAEAEIAIARKMTEGAVLFSDISKTTRGLPFQSALKNKGAVAVIGGKNVQPYAINGAKGYLNKGDLEDVKRKVSVLLQPKIVSQNIVAHIANPTPHLQITSALDLDGTLVSLDTVNNTRVTNDKFDLRFLVALLNSRLMSWYAYRFVYASAIRTMHFDEYYVGKLPVSNVSGATQSRVIALVDRILAAKKVDPAADTSTLEVEIDQMVYKLYDLIEEEIAIVEGKK